MNKKILISILVIAVAAALLGAGTMAYFTHKIQVGQVTFTAGTIEIALMDNKDSETLTWNFDDMKPCYTSYAKFNIINEGDNPVNVYKHLYNFTFDENGITAAEQQYYTDNNINIADGKNDIDTVILYDLWVKVYVPDGNNGWKWLWGQGIYDETKTLDQLECKFIYLGMIPVDGYMEVLQSYHMKANTEDWAQSDKMTFNIEVKAEQLKGELTLENKDADGNYLILHDDKIGKLTYNVMYPTFKYTFTGRAPLINTEYVLIYYADPWGTTGAVIGTGTTDVNGDVTISGDVNLGSLPFIDDANSPYGAKIWFVPSSDYDFTSGCLKAWNPQNYLFETGLIIYIDSYD